MKVLVTGAQKAPAIERYYVDHFRELSVTTEHYAAQNIFYDYYLKNIFNKVVFKAGFSRIYDQINKEFRQIVESFRPDIIWIFKGMEIFPSSLEWARAKGIRLVNYNTDNPFFFSGKGSGNKNVADSLGLYDLHLTYDRNIRRRFIEEHGLRCELLPFGFEESEELYARCRLMPEKQAVCFVGSPDNDRIAFLEAIAAELPITVYGALWDKATLSPNITVHGPVHGEAFWTTLHQYRVQLNYMRPHNPDSHNMRSFEVPGIGGIMLAPATTDHKEYFRADDEIFLYTDIQDCIGQARRLLSLSSAQALEIRERVRSRSITSGYSYLDRAKLALKWFDTIL